MAHAQFLYAGAPVTAAKTLRQHLAEWRGMIAEWRRRARSRNELAVLCDRCLRDMGATRYDANREARKPFWQA